MDHEYEIESVPDWDVIVDQIVEHIGSREECSFVDDDCEIWEVQRTEEGNLVALCMSRNALLKISRSEW